MENRLARAIARGNETRLTSLGTSLLVGRYVLKIPDVRPQEAALDLRQTRSILVLRLDEIGDVVLTSPFLRELRRNAPQAWISLVVKPGTQNLMEFCPYVNEVLTFDWRLDGRLAALRRHARALVFARRHLWRRFDLAIVPRWEVDYYHATSLAYFSGTPHRVAYSEYSSDVKAQLNRGYDRLLTQALEGKGLKHEVERNLNLLRLLGGDVSGSRLELWLTEEDRTFASQTLATHRVQNGELLLAFAPGSRAKKRCWPLERWVELGQILKQEFASRLVLVGNGEDINLGARIEKALGHTAINLVGQTTLRQTGAILEHCSLTVSNDTGPMHLGAAVGSSVVEISCHPRDGDPNHGNSPVRFHPWGVAHVVLQPVARPSCSNSCEAREPHCILGIEVESVQWAVRELLSCTWVESIQRREAASAD